MHDGVVEFLCAEIIAVRPSFIMFVVMSGEIHEVAEAHFNFAQARSEIACLGLPLDHHLSP